MELRRARCHRFQRIEHRGKNFVIDIDQVNGFLGGIHGLRRHRRHPVADETRFVPAQHWQVANLLADKQARAHPRR